MIFTAWEDIQTAPDTHIYRLILLSEGTKITVYCRAESWDIAWKYVLREFSGWSIEKIERDTFFDR